MSDEIRIYVADLAAYNNGYLHGVWIDATNDASDIYDQIEALLQSSPEESSEEWAIHDYEGFGAYRLSEYEDIESAHAIACFIEEHGEIASELLNHFSTLEESKKAMNENYDGCYDSVANFAEELTTSTTQIPEALAYYIDYEKMGQDMELSGDIFSIEMGHQKAHIFWCH